MSLGSLRHVLTVGRFAQIIDDELKQYGLPKGTTVYLAGDYTLPLNKEDPYTLYKMFVAAQVSKLGHIQTKEKAFVISPKHLAAISEDREIQLLSIRAEDFKYLEDNAANDTSS